MISAQAFGNPNASLDLGLDQTDVTQTSGIWIVFPRSVRYAFDLVLTVSGGEFADDLVEASSYVLGDRASPTEGAEYALAGAPATCANFPTNATRVVLRSCGVASGTAQTDTTPAITAVQITDLSINKAGGLASAGNSVTLTATLRDADANEDVHTSTPANIYTSVHSAQARIVTGAPLHVSPDLDPPFTKFTNPAEGSNSSNRLLKNDFERSSRQFCFRMSHFPILFFRGRPSIDSFVSRGGLSAEFFISLLKAFSEGPSL